MTTIRDMGINTVYDDAPEAKEIYRILKEKFKTQEEWMKLEALFSEYTASTLLIAFEAGFKQAMALVTEARK